MIPTVFHPTPEVCMSARYFARTLAAALGVAVAAAAPARADKIDPALLDQSEKLIQFIKGKTKGHSPAKPFTVGTLKFRAKKDGGGESLNAGPINSKMAERLEMALIMAFAYETRPKPPLHVIHDASGVVAAQKQGLSYLAPDHRAKLFALDYPLAVGTDKVRPDLFLTGTVHFDTKTRKTAVTIQGFGKDTKGFEEVARFDVDTDRATLADMGMGFALSKRDFKLPDPDAAAADSVTAAGNTPVKLAAENPVELKVFINGREVNTDYDMKDSTNKLRLLQKPNVGDRIHFTLTNKANDARYAAVLRVNGLSTLFEEKAEPLACRKFILRPNAEPILVDGFYLEEAGPGNKTPFKVSADEPAGEPMADEELGVVSLHVFAEGEAVPIPASDGVGTRGLSPRKWAAETRTKKTYAELAGALLARKADTRGFIVKGTEREDGNKLVVERFNNPTQIGHVQVRYFDRETPARD